MRRFRTTIALAIVAAMIFSLAGLAAAATVKTTAFSDVASDSTAAGAFNVLAGLGVYQGDSGVGGPARPNDPITRLEAAAVVVRLIGKESVARSLSSYAPSFTDANQIPDWGWGYVNVATTLGILKGYPDGSFQPNNNVTHAEMIAMLVRAAELDGAVTGTWPTNYVVYGGSWGITDNVDVFANLPASRAEVAMMAVNTLAIDKEIKDGKVEDADGTLRERLELAVEGTVTNVTSDKIEIDGESHDLADEVFLSGADNLNAYLNQEVVAYKVNKKVVAIAFQEADKAGTTVAGKLKDATSSQIRVDDRWYSLDNPVVVINGKTADLTRFVNSAGVDPVKDSDVTLTLKNGKVSAIRVEVWSPKNKDLAGYKSEKSDTEREVTVDGGKYTIDDDTRLVLNGDSATWREILEAIDDFENKWAKAPAAYVQTEPEEGDVNSKPGYIFGNDGRAVALEVVTSTASGEVVRKSSRGGSLYVTLESGSDRKEYKVVGGLDGKEADDVDADLGFEKEVTVALDASGAIRGVVSETAELKSFIAKLESVDQIGTSKYQLTYEFGDGSQLTTTIENPADINAIRALRGSAVATTDGGKTPVALGAADLDGTVVSRTNASLTIDKDGDLTDDSDQTTVYFSLKGVLIYDPDEDEWRSLSSLTRGTEVEIWQLGGVVWYVEIVP